MGKVIAMIMPSSAHLFSVFPRSIQWGLLSESVFGLRTGSSKPQATLKYVDVSLFQRLIHYGLKCAQNCSLSLQCWAQDVQGKPWNFHTNMSNQKHKQKDALPFLARAPCVLWLNYGTPVHTVGGKSRKASENQGTLYMHWSHWADQCWYSIYQWMPLFINICGWLLQVHLTLSHALIVPQLTFLCF